MMILPEIEDRIREFVLTSFLAETPAETFHTQADLFLLLDSLQVLRLVMQLESWYAIKVEKHELSPENLSSVQKAAAFVVRKVALANAGDEQQRAMPPTTP
jgi:acyl carrier protein